MFARQKLKEKKTVLITGASSGIGFELAKIFASKTYNLILVSKDRQRLADAVHKIHNLYEDVFIKAISKDMSNIASVYFVYKELKEHDMDVDVLVNNAGFALYGSFAQGDILQETEMMQLHVVSLTLLTKLFLSDMLKKKSGKILNVASTAAFQPGPLMVIYYATKSYIVSFSQGLASELKGTGVSVSVLCPGPTKTNLQARAGIDKIRIMSKLKLMDASKVAQAGYRGLMAGKTVIIPGFSNKVLAHLVRFIPRKITTNMVKRIHERK